MKIKCCDCACTVTEDNDLKEPIYINDPDTVPVKKAKECRCGAIYDWSYIEGLLWAVDHEVAENRIGVGLDEINLKRAKWGTVR